MVSFSHNLKKRNEFLREALAAFVEIFEKTVIKYPLHWFNYYDFWKLPVKTN